MAVAKNLLPTRFASYCEYLISSSFKFFPNRTTEYKTVTCFLHTAVTQNTIWCWAQFVNKVITAVGHLDIVAPQTDVVIPVITHLSSYAALCLAWVFTIQPARSSRTAVIDGRCWFWHLVSRSRNKAVPGGRKFVVTLYVFTTGLVFCWSVFFAKRLVK